MTLSTVLGIFSTLTIASIYSIRKYNLNTIMENATTKFKKEPIILNRSFLNNYYMDKHLDHTKSHYKRVIVNGKINKDEYILFGPNNIKCNNNNSNTTTIGYYVISPMKLEIDNQFNDIIGIEREERKKGELNNDINILINLGWVSSDNIDLNKMKIKNYNPSSSSSSSSSTIKILGSISPITEPFPSLTLLNNYPNENKWYYLNVKEMSNYLKTYDLMVNLIEQYDDDDNNNQSPIIINKFNANNVLDHIANYNHSIINIIKSKL